DDGDSSGDDADDEDEEEEEEHLALADSAIVVPTVEPLITVRLQASISLPLVGEVNTRVTELAELHERDIQDLYALLENA
ncbi:hypothetical protein Tco_0547261, partial [Tanacetum coccineum]